MPVAAVKQGEGHATPMVVTTHLATVAQHSSAQLAYRRPRHFIRRHQHDWCEEDVDRNDQLDVRRQVDQHLQTAPANDSITFRRASLVQDAMDILGSSLVDVFGILDVMRLLPHDAQIQSLACEKLWVQSWDDDHAITIGRVGGIGMVVGAMARFPTQQHLQQCAVETLQNLAAINHYNSRTICQLGGVQRIVQAMIRDLDDTTDGTPSLHVCGCLAIASLAESASEYLDEIIRDGAADAVLHAARCFADLQSVVEASAQAMQALGYNPNVHIIELE